MDRTVHIYLKVDKHMDLAIHRISGMLSLIGLYDLFGVEIFLDAVVIAGCARKSSPIADSCDKNNGKNDKKFLYNILRFGWP